MNHIGLELSAACWLRFDRRCPLVMFERKPYRKLKLSGRPDVLGITSNRHMVEVEVKRTISDLKANGKKRHYMTRDYHIRDWPLHFYYLVPRELADRTLEHLATIGNKWAGVMIPHIELLYWTECQAIEVIRRPQKNAQARKLTLKQCVEAAHLMTNTLITESAKVYRMTKQYRDDYIHPII